MTLAERLENTGVRLDQEIGFIVVTRNGHNDWIASHARIGRVSTDIPDGYHDLEEVQNFDPEFDLLVLSQSTGKKNLYVLRLQTGDTYANLEPSGLAIMRADMRIVVGQSLVFMDTVCDAMVSIAL